MLMLLIEMSLWVISAFLLSLAPLLTKSYKGCKCICANGVNSSKKTSSDSDSDLDTDSTTSLGIEKSSKMNGLSWWQKKLKRKSSFSISGIRKYRYNELKAATHNFTTSIGQGNASNFYKAKMPNGESHAIKVLATNVRQGKREFQAEAQLLARLHHRNLVNLVGYCIEKRQYMLVYAYMNNGSLATHLYSGKHEVLNWNVRFNIALDVASCLEYLHHGTVPPVVHRDIKSSNILLNSSMRARVTGFGVSRKETLRPHSYKVKGSFGYVDPEYILTRIYTTKSDVFSFGVLLFELIAGRTPKAGLLEYVELAVINTEGNSGWEELVDSRLEDEYYIQELNGMAALAYRCIDSSPINRPSMKDIVQELSQIRNFPNNCAMLEEVPISKYAYDIQNPMAGDGREEADDTSPVLLRCFSV
ncbi:Protein kinase domain-containing protein [Cinnamomum micranthum f. kanehirae]|uniref:Protein kinase domain-containing protein n=1 Tax=Cinnamomum micranthum f. kanehirae TaxID=337451 RepID=A0A3S3NSL1_9MAGN|nr:Protein kinase domain-containing protein [Cinnamomum micranthum f. kanehirae]